MQQYWKIATRTIVVIALVIAVSLSPLEPARATSNTPVYTLGVTNPTDPLISDLLSLTSSVTVLPSVLGLSNLNAGSILYIDGSWLASASSLDPTVTSTIVQTVLAGVPTIVVRGDPYILAKSVPGLMRYENPGLPLVAEGVHTIGTLADGTTQGSVLRVISGFDYSVSAEFQWANQFLSPSTSLPLLARISSDRTGMPATVTQAGTGPYWQLLLNATTDSGQAFTAGQVVTTFSLYGLQNSNSTSYKWYNVFANQTFTPNTHDGYRNYLETAFAQPVNQTSNTFVDNGPGSLQSSGPSTVTFSVGVQSGVANATVTSSQTMSYFLKNTNLNNASNPPNVSWVQTINGQTAVGKLTLQTIQGFTDKVVQGSQMNVQGNVTVTFATYSNSQVATTAPEGIAFGIGSA